MTDVESKDAATPEDDKRCPECEEMLDECICEEDFDEDDYADICPFCDCEDCDGECEVDSEEDDDDWDDWDDEDDWDEEVGRRG